MARQHICATFQKQLRQERQETSCCAYQQSPYGETMNFLFTSVVVGPNNPSELYVKLADSTEYVHFWASPLLHTHPSTHFGTRDGPSAISGIFLHHAADGAAAIVSCLHTGRCIYPNRRLRAFLVNRRPIFLVQSTISAVPPLRLHQSPTHVRCWRP